MDLGGRFLAPDVKLAAARWTAAATFDAVNHKYIVHWINNDY